MCSTPFGVTDLVTRPRRPRRSPSNCAQRLSASQTWSRWDRAGLTRGDKCSTPFGVTDLVTCVAAAPTTGPVRCSTPFGVTDLVTLGAAGALAAAVGCSTPFGVTDLVTAGRIAPSGRRSGAQRLSASQTWSRRLRWPRRGAVTGVLNAFRRHRLGHAAGLPVLPDLEVCSTPFGVTDLVTVVGLARGARPGRVLNAFRRHRLGHSGRDR